MIVWEGVLIKGNGGNGWQFSPRIGAEMWYLTNDEIEVAAGGSLWVRVELMAW